MELTSSAAHQEIKLEESAVSPQLADSEKFNMQI
jgi:hypothetical protein